MIVIKIRRKTEIKSTFKAKKKTRLSFEKEYASKFRSWHLNERLLNDPDSFQNKSNKHTRASIVETNSSRKIKISVFKLQSSLKRFAFRFTLFKISKFEIFFFFLRKKSNFENLNDRNHYLLWKYMQVISFL